MVDLINMVDLTDLSILYNIAFCRSITIKFKNDHPKYALKYKSAYSKNKIEVPIPLTIDPCQHGSMKWKSIFYTSGMIIYEIHGCQRKQGLPLLLIVGWEIPRFGRNKYSVHVGYQTDAGLMESLYAEGKPDSDRGLKILLKNGCTESVSRCFDHFIIEISMSNGSDAKLDINFLPVAVSQWMTPTQFTLLLSGIIYLLYYFNLLILNSNFENNLIT
ncbi:hypothetical protein C1645_873294 [Glomus cerebriforme]|uniref:Uncharacterized protein n=1 Tax=Glomus cerebriforme TaxID=658196 RepID=A0A397TBB4_9GLOM|nr:hypothetical protein C1645_873294 [Glomus cerebriforme]